MAVTMGKPQNDCVFIGIGILQGVVFRKNKKE
jgi:hypothetical protein